MINKFIDLGIKVNSSSAQQKTECPECQKSGKSVDLCLSIDLVEGLYNCHRCGHKGCVNKPQNTSQLLPSPIKSQTPQEYRPSPIKELTGAILTFFEKRGISKDTLMRSDVRCADMWFHKYKKVVENVIAFQFIKDNKRVNTKYRTASKDMMQDKGGEKCFYRFDKLKGAKEIYITEGEMDALSLIECGFDVGVTSVPDGAPNADSKNLDNKFSYFTEEAMKVFDDAEKVYLVVDNDENGKCLEYELRRRIGIDKCMKIEYPGDCKDINEVLMKLGCDAVKEVINKAEHFPVSGLKTFKDYSHDIINMFNGVGEKHYSTGYPHMDKHLKIKTGQLNVVTGSPGSGKSEWVDDMMINTIKSDGLKWAVFSPENYPPKVYFRKLSEKFEEKPFDTFSEGTLKNSINELSDYVNLIVDNDEDEVTLDYLFERIRALVFRHGIKGVIIDPWNEMAHDIGAREDIYLSKQLRRIKRFIRRYDLTLWLVAHPKNPARDKEGNYQKVTAYDIAGGYTWHAKADNLFSVWRNKVDKTKPVEVDIQKIKYKTDGELGVCYFFYQYETGKFKSSASSLDTHEPEGRDGEKLNDNGWS